MSVEAGQVLTGKVTGIAPFGAFVEIGEDQSGLVHISQISDQFIKDIKDFMSVGDEVEVKVLSVESDGKISLTMRHDEDKEGKKEARPENTQRRQSRPPRPRKRQARSQDFDQMMNNFLRDSEDRLASLRRNTEGKRGGRGGRRN